MKQRTLGQAHTLVGALGLGCMSMSQSYGVPDLAEKHRAYLIEALRRPP